MLHSWCKLVSPTWMEQCRNQVYAKVWRVLIDDEWIFDDTEKGSLQVDVRRGVGVCEGWGFIRNFPLIIKTFRLATTRDVPTKESFSSARLKIHYSRRATGRVRRTPQKKRWKYDYDRFARWINWKGIFSIELSWNCDELSKFHESRLTRNSINKCDYLVRVFRNQFARERVFGLIW